MGFKRLILISLLIFSLKTSAFTKLIEERSPIKIGVELKANRTLRLRYLNDVFLEEVITFKNNSQKDSMIRKEVISNSPIEMRYSMMVQNNQELKNYNYIFFLSPKDSITFKQLDNYDITSTSQNNNAVFANIVLEFYNVFDKNLGNETKKAIESGINEYDKYLKTKYESNLRKLDSLDRLGVISWQTKALWSQAVRLDYVNRQLIPINSNQALDTSFQDKVIKAKSLSDHFLIRAYSYKQILNSVIKYQLLSNKKETNDLEIFTEYVLNSGWKDQIILGALIDKLDGSPEKSSKEFQKCIDKIMSFSWKNKIIDLSIRYSKAYALDKILIRDVSGKICSMQQLLLKADKEIVIIDFWASWCKPCREEIPIWEKIKQNIPTQNIGFISISLDRDSETSSWVKAMKEENTIKELHQYKAIDSTSATLKKKFDMNEIPRYIILNRNGTVLNDDFLRPSSEQFERKLKSYLENKQ
jgi:thiol-disulfide isomerase/thioredoxin